MKKLWTGLAAGLFFIGMVGVAQATVMVYSNDFESGAGTEWSNGTIGYDNDTSNFLGRFGNQRVDLNLSGLAEHSEITVHFDLILWDSWDGSYNWTCYRCAPDHQGLKADNTWIYAHTFTSPQFSFPQTNPDHTPQLTGNFGFNNRWQDMLYRDYNNGFTFAHNATDLTLSFYGWGLQGLNDESWAIDNIEVSSNATVPVPAPTTMLLLGPGLVGLAGSRFRKRKKEILCQA